MRKKIILLSLILLFQIMGSSGFSVEEKGVNLYDTIKFEKHMIDGFFKEVGSIQIADIDNDGYKDIIGASYTQGVSWWKNMNGNPIAWEEQIINNNIDGSSAIFSIDIDNDDDNDIIGADWNEDELILWYNDGENVSSWTKQILSRDFSGCQSIYGFDIDGDGDNDLIASAAFSDKISWWRNDGGSPINFVECNVDKNFDGPVSVYVKDLDKDGDVDVLSASYGLNIFCWWENQGGNPLSWERRKIGNSFEGAHSIHSYDIDGDNDLDVIGAAYHSNELILWENNGDYPIKWNEQIIDGNFMYATTVLSEDMDNDGDGDIIATSQGKGEIAIWWNNGDKPISWIKQVIDSSYSGAWPLCISDLDDDTDLDIISGAHYSHDIAWWENSLFNVPEKPSQPQGAIDGKAGKSYTYMTNTTDLDDDSLYYWFDWSDGTNSGWIGPYNSGDYCEASHVWIEKDNYEIRVRAKDEYGLESEWSDPLLVGMSKNKQFGNFYLIFERFFDRFLFFDLFVMNIGENL